MHLFEKLVRQYVLLEDVLIEAVVPDGHGARLVEVNGLELGSQFGWNFEDFDEMWRAVTQMLGHLCGEEKVAECDIALDLTGGRNRRRWSVPRRPSTATSVTSTYACTDPKDPEADVWDYEVLDYDLVLGRASQVP